MGNHSFTEKRNYRRVNVDLEVLCRSIPSDKEKDISTLHFYTKDIGAGGLFLKSNIKFDKDSLMFLKFFLPSLNKTITTMGRVIWSADLKTHKEQGAGIKFEHLSFSDFKIINDFVNLKINISN